jgi:hypothetical protein
MQESHLIINFEQAADHLVQFLHNGGSLSEDQNKQLKCCIEAVRLTYEDWSISQRKVQKASQPA